MSEVGLFDCLKRERNKTKAKTKRECERDKKENTENDARCVNGGICDDVFGMMLLLLLRGCENDAAAVGPRLGGSRRRDPTCSHENKKQTNKT